MESADLDSDGIRVMLIISFGDESACRVYDFYWLFTDPVHTVQIVFEVFQIVGFADTSGCSYPISGQGQKLYPLRCFERALYNELR